jgi:hypothetical protein
MSTQVMFIITKSGITIRPEGIDLAISHARSYMSHLSGLLTELQEAAAQARKVAPEGIPQEDSVIADAKRELGRAEVLLGELEGVRGHTIHIYDRNFEDWAEVFRQARIERGQVRIEDSPDLFTAVKIVMAMLKAENHWFSESKFIKFINNDDPSSITRQARRVSA